MKETLKKIYQDLSDGKLTREQAFKKIKEFKIRETRNETGTVLASPVWQTDATASVPASGKLPYVQQHIVLCDMPQHDRMPHRNSGTHLHNVQLEIHQDSASRFTELSLYCFQVVQTILQQKPQGKILLQIVIADKGEGHLFIGLDGLLKTAALENPLFRGQLLLVHPDIQADELTSKLEADSYRPEDAIIQYEHNKRSVLRWKEIEKTGHEPRIAFKDQGVYLITGGLGGVGVLFAEEIVRQTNKATIIVTGRSELTAEKKVLLDKLSGNNTSLVYRQLDLTDPGRVKACLETLQKEYKTLNGILHSAGMNSDTFLIKKTPDEFKSVLLPKVQGSFNLDQASQEIDLDFFVMFSSLAACFGNVGQADYAVANGFMDQFASYRRRLVSEGKRQGKTLAFNWPFWQDGGMKIDEASQELMKQQLGLQAMNSATGMRVFYQGLESVAAQVLIMEGTISRIHAALFEEHALTPAIASDERPAMKETQQDTLNSTTMDEITLLDKTRNYLCAEFSAVLRLASHQIDAKAPLEKYGIDSILSMNLTSQLEKSFGTLPKTLFFEYQSIQELATYFVTSYKERLKQLFAAQGPKEDQTSTPVSRPEPLVSLTGKKMTRQRLTHQRAGRGLYKHVEHEPVAIIGLSGRYPESATIQQFWHNLRDGKDCIIEVPASRWDWREYYSEDRTVEGRHYSKWGGFIEGVDEFDPRFFNISPREAATIDPQERLFLQHAWMAIEDAGYTRDTLQIPHEDDQPGQVGVYAGVMYGEYNLSGSLASIANRVSYFLNIHGPSMTLDSMCSSSLTAIHLACHDLKQGRTSLALAGGVNVSIDPHKYLMLSSGQFISSDGHCQSFGEGGDGYIPGEGVGVVVLKRLSEAEKDGNHIYGIIKGSALNHGGKTNGYTVPNPKAQTNAISRALKEAACDARQISYIEAHGTGTRLGDPIEIASMTKAFASRTPESGECLIGSAKSNIGHCESAAGIAGLTKVLLQMKYRQIVPSLHSKRLNPHIDFEKTPFVVNQTLQQWEQPVIDGKPQPRMAGISSFGAGGSNAHIIVEEYQSAENRGRTHARSAPGEKYIVPLSARTSEQLRQRAVDLLAYIRLQKKGPGEDALLNLAAMAYTLQVGREAMDERLGFLVTSMENLENLLQAYLDGTDDGKAVFRGQVKQHKETLSLFAADTDLQETIEKWIRNSKYAKLAELWVKGLELDWNKLCGEIKPGLISLPAYPFAKERYWKEERGTQQPAAPAASSMLHPLLHCNTSDFRQQSYGATFRGDELFLADYRVMIDNSTSQNMLTAATCLEMARAAVTHAMPDFGETGSIVLQDLVWAGPIVAGKESMLSLALFAADNEEIAYELSSQDQDREIIHFQGVAAVSLQPSLPKIDITALKSKMQRVERASAELYRFFAGEGLDYGPAYRGVTSLFRGEGQALAQLRIADRLETSLGDYLLHPGLVDGALQAVVGLLDANARLRFQPSLPFAIGSLRVVFACTKEMYAWVRYADHGIDIDLCDPAGNICVELRGVTYQEKELSSREEGAMAAAVTSSDSEDSIAPREIILPPSQKRTGRVTTDNSMPLSVKKPDAISLIAPETVAATDFDVVSAQKGTILLPSLVAASSAAMNTIEVTSDLRLYDNGNGIYILKIATGDGNNSLGKDLIAEMQHALDVVRESSSLKVLILEGHENVFLQGGREAINEAITQTLFQTLISFPFPMIASMRGNALGAGFMTGALADFMVCSQTASYAYTMPEEGMFPSRREDLLLKERFSEHQVHDLLYQRTRATGAELLHRGWNCSITSADEVEEYARNLALDLAEKPRESLRLLKQHLAHQLVPFVQTLTPEQSFSSEGTSGKSAEKITSPLKQITLTTHAEQTLVIRLEMSRKKLSLDEIVAALTTIFQKLNNSTHYRAIVLHSTYPGFLPDSKKAFSAETIMDFEQLLLGSRLPVIGVLDHNAKGAALLLAQFFDVTLYHEQGNYTFDTILEHATLARQANIIVPLRFGEYAGKEILLRNTMYTGNSLRQKNKSLYLVEKEGLLATALGLAETWSTLPLEALVAWKQQNSAKVQEHIARCASLPDNTVHKSEEHAVEACAAPQSIRLQSKVISATRYPQGIVLVKMEDRNAKNLFSEELAEGMQEIFAHIETTPAYKVVVLTGFDTYFAAGGTKQTLLDIQEGKAQFTDNKVYQLPLICKLPVIAAMQGHGIGAGWSLGMFADMTFFSEESHYMSPYMNYGFTPGAGATLIIPEKIGNDLGRESLLTARQYTGRALQEKGLMLPVLPRAEIEAAAMELARAVATHTRARLIDYKKQWTMAVLARLEDTYQRELAMHDTTFVGQSETLQQIHDKFGQQHDLPHAKEKHVEEAIRTTEKEALPGQEGQKNVISKLRTLLARELHITEDEIDDDTQFVDLGLDSITGVTWIRKINELYKTSIEATKVYTYPTLDQLGRYVNEQAQHEGALPTETIASLPVDGQASPATGVARSSKNEILPSVRADLKRLLAEELHLAEDEIDEDEQFVDLGLDSITGVTWIRRINELYQTSIEATKVYTYPTLNQLAEHVKEEAVLQGTFLTTALEEVPVKPVTVKQKPVRTNDLQADPPVTRLTSLRERFTGKARDTIHHAREVEPVAVIGMAGQFPQARNIDEFWTNIAEGRNCISEVSAKRWDLASYFSEGKAIAGKTNCKWFGAMEEYDLFDPLFFTISPTEAENMDPQQRLFLQTCWHGIEHAGYNPKELSGSKCGVFVGCANSDYHLLSREQQVSAQGFTGGATSILAARISYFLNLRGPCLAIETACSSSLVAIANACDSLQTGSSDLALAGGVFVMVGPELHIKTSQTGMLSTDGRCFTFDQRANGFVPGESVGVVMLKRLSEAERDGDTIYGVIRGWGVNQDGKTNGITAPNAASQACLLQDVYNNYRIDPAEIQLIEAHGTGTKLGDPIEVEALKESFAQYTDKKDYCALGSVKSNIGHCLTAAGVSGVIKVLLALQHKQLPPTIHFTQLNEHIHLDESPFYINDRLQDWERGDAKQRQAAVSAFGFGGTNAHLVIAEHVPARKVKQPVAVKTQHEKQMIVLSARTEEQLRQKARDIMDFITTNEQRLELTDIAYTLQIGRQAMGERLAFLAGSPRQVVATLRAYLEGAEHIEDFYQGEVKRNKEGLSIISKDDDMKGTIIDTWIAQGKLSKLLSLWVKGLELDWQKFYGETKPCRISLPGYPFAKERYWIETAAEHFAAENGRLHPLLHRNISDFTQQGYSSLFNGQEFFCRDCQISGKKALPAISLLEMVYVAVNNAGMGQDESDMLAVYELQWDQPLYIQHATEIMINLEVRDEAHVNVAVYSSDESAGDLSEETIYLQGEVGLQKRPVMERLDVIRLKEQMTIMEHGAELLYGRLARMGTVYGEAYQAVDTLYRGEDQLLASLFLPAPVKMSAGDFYLHPVMMESMMQLSVSLLSGEDQHAHQPYRLDSLETVSVLAPCTEKMYAWVRRAEGDQECTLDIDLVDHEGNYCILLRGLVIAEAGTGHQAGPVTAVSGPSHDEAEIVMMTPAWDVVRLNETDQPERTASSLLIIGADKKRKKICEQVFTAGRVTYLNISENDSVPEIAEWIEKYPLDRIIWIAPQNRVQHLTEPSLIDDQEQGVVQVFRIVKALLALGYEDRNISWELITCNSQVVKQNDMADPTHASLQGFSGSMAKEYPHWNVRLFDLDAFSEIPLRTLWRLPSFGKGSSYAYREGEWFRQKLLKVTHVSREKEPYRSEGVYVVIGGSGGLGEVWSRHVIEKYRARVIWIGRRKPDEKIEQKLESLATRGPRPEYIRADARNLEELQAAYQAIRKKYPEIHGVVHSAVGDFDESLKTVEEAYFRSILAVKIDLSVRIAQVFEKETLDFVLFFSSNSAFVRERGMSGYSAGCTFKDTFALQLSRIWSCDVKVMNWGYWAIGAGESVSESMKTRFYQSGHRAIEPEEGMKVLDELLAGSFQQLSVVKTTPSTTIDFATTGEWITGYEQTAGEDVTDLSFVKGQALPAVLTTLKTKVGTEMEGLLVPLLSTILSSTPHIQDFYGRWLEESKKLVAAKGHPVAEAGKDLSVELAALWEEWDRTKESWLADKSKKALCILVEKCVRALSDILTGRQKATDVLFPNSSLELVEEVYKSEAVSLAFNETLSDTLVNVIRNRLQQHPEAGIRVLEIGAGTGATTVKIIEKLKPYREQVEEYCYTDLSKAFLFHAEKTYAPSAPYLRTQIFNVEEPLADQHVAVGHYDVVIAANVLHATKNIRNTLRNAKAVLKKNGLILINEISDKSLYGHLTFGLLDGWWLNEDDEIRIPGSPGLYPEMWKQIFEEEGFDAVMFPAAKVHALGQQIVLAKSNGVVRQKEAVTARPVARTGGQAAKTAKPVQEETMVETITPAGNADKIKEKTIRYLKQVIGNVLKISSSQLDAAEPLESYGIDSIIIGLVNDQLQKHFDDIGSTLLFEFQTIDALAAYLLETQQDALQKLFAIDNEPREKEREQLSSGNTPVQPVTVASRPASRRAHRFMRRAALASGTVFERSPIAVIGMSGIYPQAANLEEYWENLRSGKNCITEIPGNRWSLEGFYEPDEQRAIEDAKSYCKWGGFIDQFADFDALFFGISPREAMSMDPQERLFLQAAWHALESSGYTRKDLQQKYRQHVGVFAGITRPGYNLYRSDLAIRKEQFYPRTSFGSVANRLSYFLNITGPSLPIDTMCSSSLTAIHEACEHIHRGECSLAFAGGVNVYVHPSSYVDMSAQHMFSRDGLCKTFGEGANGFVPGEGVGAVLLKPLDQAERDNDTIHGLILATHLNHDGKTNGYTVPNPKAQAEVIRTAIDKAGISARDISYIEAHGTGTELGDPIEISGLQQAFSKDTRDLGYCKIGSAKSNMGHLEAAAGVAGLTKVLLQMKHQQIAPSLHSEKLNPHINFQKTFFEVNQSLCSWEQPLIDGTRRPRIAGISAFGAGGVNAHVIVQEYLPETGREHSGSISIPGKKHIVPLSAKSEEQLRQNAEHLLDFLRGHDGTGQGSTCRDIDLAAMAYTLQVGREEMEVRVGFIVDSVEQLTLKLEMYLRGEDAIDDLYQGTVKRKNEGLSMLSQDDDMKETLQKWISNGKFSKLLDLWVKGFEMEWEKLYDEITPGRIDLPVYAFATEQYWIDTLDLRQEAARVEDYAGNFSKIEDILNRVDDDAIDETLAVEMLKDLT